MRVVICTSLYPPEIGGPATHARDLSSELTDRGHSVIGLALSDSPPCELPPECVAIRRGLPWPAWFLAVTRWLLRNRRRYEVPYATGLQGPAVLAARLARRPVVVKVVGDPAWERARRLGSISAGFDEFQKEDHDSVGVSVMRAFRSWWARRATAVTVPSEFLRRVVLQWG